LTCLRTCPMLMPVTGKVYLVGIGPGQPELMTPQARETIERVKTIIGQPDTLAHIESLTQGKDVLATESNPLERSRLAVEKAGEGEVAIVSSGDPGTYAIAATFFSYLRDNDLNLDVEVVPGLNLAAYAASRLGAPLGGDFAAISLTDQGTPWPLIKKRLEAAAKADFVIVMFNPLGKLGPERLQEALGIIGRNRKPATPVGVLSQAATRQESLSAGNLSSIDPLAIPADTLIIVGNSQTYISDGRMVTPRAYLAGLGY
jgi:precorrin-3B C17-methyltransferase / cobalt-factor III methyltransferase